MYQGSHTSIRLRSLQSIVSFHVMIGWSRYLDVEVTFHGIKPLSSHHTSLYKFLFLPKTFWCTPSPSTYFLETQNHLILY